MLILVTFTFWSLAFISQVYSDYPCLSNWIYSSISGKCYNSLSFFSNQSNGIAMCQSTFSNFSSYATNIKLLRIIQLSDITAVSNVLPQTGNKASQWLDAQMMSNGVVTWSDGTAVNFTQLGTFATIVNAMGPCFILDYNFILQQGGSYSISYTITGVNCSYNLAAMTCEHLAVTCDPNNIPNFSTSQMQLVPQQITANMQYYVSCVNGYYRQSEINGVPVPSGGVIPPNYINCTLTADSSGNPFLGKANWIMNINQGYIETCTAVSCSAPAVTPINIANQFNITAQTYNFGFQFNVQCSQGYVSYQNPMSIYSTLSCNQSSVKTQGIWYPINYMPCVPIQCNLTQLMQMIPLNGALMSARNKVTQRTYDVNFQTSLLPYYNNIITIKCNDQFFYPDRTWQKQVICSTQNNSQTIGQWQGYMATIMPLPSSCIVVTCAYENVVIQPTYNLQPYWFQMDSNGVYQNQSTATGNPYPYNAQLRFLCLNGFSTANQNSDQNLTCGPQGIWIPNLTPCIQNTQQLNLGGAKHYVPTPQNAPSATEVGYVAIIILVVFLTIIVVLDLSTIRRDYRVLKTNIKNLRQHFKQKKG